MIVSSRSRWKLSVIDVLFILIIFFVIVISHSRFDVEKFTLFKLRRGEISGNKGLVASTRGLPGPPMVKPLYPARKRVVRKIESTTEKLKEKYPLLKGFKVVEEERSVKLSLPTNITFKSGSYRLNRAALELIKGLCPVFNDPSVERIIVKGHTDSRPGTDNWLLSARRAESVLMAILKECKTPKGKFEVMACADTEPVAPNSTPEGRRRNRRVEIVLTFKGETGEPRKEG